MTTFDPRKISKHRSYTIRELSDVLGMSEKTCLRWIAKGMITISGNKKPILISGDEAKKFIRNKNSETKVELQRHEFYCFKCKCPRRAKRGSIHLSTNTKRGSCSVCSTKMSRTINPIKKDYKIPSIPIQMSIFS